MELAVIVTKGELGYFVARVPALKGCWSQGRTRDEAIANAREAAELWLEVEQEKSTKSLGAHSEVVPVRL
ncbi:MAG: type II toxin-antitoxin system HicB family antitoxin [Armatimonadetes bacterium]|nr:type II toxin-antitoxin system HicB family antitoxin [Armatimonadota bacterium]